MRTISFREESQAGMAGLAKVVRPFMSISECSEEFGFPEGILETLIQQESFPVMRVGSVNYIMRDVMKAFISGGGVPIKSSGTVSTPMTISVSRDDQAVVGEEKYEYNGFDEYDGCYENDGTDEQYIGSREDQSEKDVRYILQHIDEYIDAQIGERIGEKAKKVKGYDAVKSAIESIEGGECFTKKQIDSMVPEFSEKTVERSLQDLQAEGEIIKFGSRKSAHYRRASKNDTGLESRDVEPMEPANREMTGEYTENALGLYERLLEKHNIGTGLVCNS